jgi:hypothetical protein
VNRQTGRQTDMRTDGQIGGQTNRKADGQMFDDCPIGYEQTIGSNPFANSSSGTHETHGSVHYDSKVFLQMLGARDIHSITEAVTVLFKPTPLPLRKKGVR